MIKQDNIRRPNIYLSSNIISCPNVNTYTYSQTQQHMHEEYQFIAITSRSTLTQSGSTW